MNFTTALNSISSQSLSIFIMLLGVGLFVLASHTGDHDTKAAILTAASSLFTGSFALLKTSTSASTVETHSTATSVESHDVRNPALTITAERAQTNTGEK
jgi:hypothetical protein